MTPGDVYWAELPDIGGHYVVVISRPELNRGGYLRVVIVTSQRFETRSQMPSCVPFRAGDHCFTMDCVAQCDALSTIEIAIIRDFDAGPLATLPDEVYRDLVLAVGYVMDAACEPN